MGGVLLLRSASSSPLVKPVSAVRACPDGYAPFDFIRDPALLGLAVQRRSTSGGVLEVLQRPSPRSAEVYLFIHGLNGSWMSWTPLLQALQSNGTLGDADLVLLDMRHMSTPTSESGLQEFARFLVEDVCARWTQVHLVGHSVGGGIALAIAASHPDRVSSVHLVAANFMRLYREARTTLPFPLSRDGVRAAAGTFRVSSRAGSLGRFALWVAWRTRTLRRLVRDVYFAPDHLADGIIATIPENFSPQHTRATIQLVRAINQSEMYARVEVPVFAVAGETDRMSDAADLIEFRKALCHTTVQITTIIGTGHCPHIERPFDTIDALFPASASATF